MADASMTDASGAGEPPNTGDDDVDEALRALPSVPDHQPGDAGADVELGAPIESVTAVHQRLQQRLSDLSR